MVSEYLCSYVLSQKLPATNVAHCPSLLPGIEQHSIHATMLHATKVASNLHDTLRIFVAGTVARNKAA